MTKNNIKKPRIVFWGTPEFALFSLKALWDAKYPILAVVTNPDEPAGRGRKMVSPPIKIFAEKEGIPFLQPTSLTDNTFRGVLPAADLFVVVAYGKIIPKEILEIPPLGAINVHPSLLPRWRGPSPIQYTILQGDTETGVTVISIDEQMDHGPVIANAKFKMKNSKLTYRELHGGLAKMGAELLINTLSKWTAGEITPVPQDDFRATYSKKIKKDDGRINWKNPADVIDRQIRAFSFWPGAWTLWPAKERIFRIRIDSAVPLQEDGVGSPGSIKKKGNELAVQTGKGTVLIKKLTIEGKKSSDAASFIRGYPDIANSVFV